MKKILTLFISVLMLFSAFGLTVSAATSYEAELLSALSIMHGDPDGNMRYYDYVSRAECAKIVVAASAFRDSVDMESKRSPFKDVTSDHWAAPYVTVGIKNGLFKGYFDATFRPSNTVLYEEAITMLLRVLDYTDEDVGTDWPYDQINMAKKIGMLDGVNKSSSQPLTRRDISKMVYNTLNAKAKGSQETYLSSFNRTIGPITVLSPDWYEEFGADSSLRVMRDGETSSLSAVMTNDIAYYMPEYKTALVYSKKVTGIYESATPNKDAPVSVTVSGITYNIEGDDAYSNLSSGGDFNYGDTVTLLLGKSGDVAGVAVSSKENDTVYGFLSAVGTKETTVSGTKVTKSFVKVILPNGDSREYITNKNYDSYLNSVVSVKLVDGIATVSLKTANHNVSGTVTWDSNSRKIGSHTLADDVDIIETSTVRAYESATVASVYPQRLNGIRISANDILYVSKNSDGNIDSLILNDITGDIHTYGIVTKVKNDNNASSAGNYEYLVSGVKNTISGQNTSFAVSVGQGVKIESNGKGISSMTALSALPSNKITDINGSFISLGEKTYVMSDSVQIYLKESFSHPYSMISLDELSDLYVDYHASVYTDRALSAGGRIRVIVLSK